MKKSRMFKKKSFTLIELIIIIVIIGLLAVVSIPKFINLKRDAQKASCFGSSASIQTALSLYYSRRAIASTAQFPESLHEVTFYTGYFADRTLPDHPLNWDWNSYYSSSTGFLYTGKGKASGGCTGW
ncbi:MAG: prepilin-type N-terminal cleavage/methylation domain-containing protein [Candidatus Omnitrophica bacterium]|nr:prepilin-type N-terminal cleavage/methylation domain-containing protein [Candidatus Omnitrophota bacterium]MBU0878894.1 prepilin-type N-terminal cleavage/methylation domain-containing protein [Candidatus Omnitrophota bacterium]MBU0896900.1 prepilin-type N-terminal cleavage/methylation domain-containing protein [Candidatus Omnitrophota bacterium]MBU1811200.1 prepilin-type N-terminal cleavage/methylation domain-containing protein [Candidatus Omnitrophota bacterium]